MPYLIAIDTGGTFTDGFIYGDGRAAGLKVDTTPHDPTVVPHAPSRVSRLLSRGREARRRVKGDKAGLLG